MTSDPDRTSRHGLDPLFRPTSIAVIGASANPARIGGRPVASLLRAGFAGPIYPINPGQPTVAGLPAFASLDDVPVPWIRRSLHWRRCMRKRPSNPACARA